MIRESQNWKNMNVPMSQKFEEKEILTLQPEEFKILETVVYNDSKEVCEFVKTYNQTLSENINYFPKNLLSFQYICLTTLEIENKIMSFALASIIPIRAKTPYHIIPKEQDWQNLISKDVLLYGYTNYLCSREKGKGYGIRSIQATLNYGIPRGVLCGYYIVTSPKTANYLELKNWIRPLNYSVAKLAGFKFPSFRKKGDKSELRNDLYYKIKLDKNLVFALAKSVDLEKYYGLVKDGTFVFYPNHKFWDQWTSVFNTYTLSENGKVISVGSILITETMMTKTNKVLKICNIALLVGDPRILGYLLEMGNKLGAGIAMGYQIGSLNMEILGEIKCFDSGTMFLEFYNTSIVHKAEGIMAPIY